MRVRTEERLLKKLPPLLEIDEDGLPLTEMDLYAGRRWSSDESDPSVQMADFPADFDD
jgi:hypothetical protein